MFCLAFVHVLLKFACTSLFYLVFPVFWCTMVLPDAYYYVCLPRSVVDLVGNNKLFLVIWCCWSSVSVVEFNGDD